jgi:hypothetical protein
MRSRSVVSGATIGVLALAGAGIAGAVDPNAASSKTCESVINGDIMKQYSHAKSIAWDWGSVTEKKSSSAVTLRGQGTYKGKSGKGRTYDFECEYDTENDRVTTGWWQSSFDGKRHAVGSGTSTSGPTEDDIANACQKAVNQKVRSDFEHSIKTVELIDDSITGSESPGARNLKGQGRFQGGGGGWHRFDFTCTYALEDEEVTNVTWKHLGDEKDLD